MFTRSRASKLGKRWGGLWAALLIASLALAGCGGLAAEPEMALSYKDAAAPQEYAAGASDRSATYSTVDQVDVQEQLIIRNAQLSIVVDDTSEGINAIRALVSGLEGWEVSSNVWEYNDVKRGNITVRVPADQLDAFIDQVRGLANEVTNESISGEDVTDEYVDLNAQLINLEATRDRVRNFLDDAKDVEDALAVNAELSRLEGEIERITGRLQYLEKSARYSSVSIEIIPDELAQPVTIGGWQPEGTARDAIQALVNALQFLIDALIVIVLFVLPLLLVIGLPIYLVFRWLRKRRARRRAAAIRPVEPPAEA